jgi:hypothetical protein
MENIIYILRDYPEAVATICMSAVGFICYHLGRATERQEGGY